MKNKKLLFFSLVFLIVFSSTPSSMAAPFAYLTINDLPDATGDTFAVEVWIDGDNINLNLLSFGFDINLETNSIFKYTGYTIETLFDDDSIFMINGIAGSTFPGIINNNVLLATLNFEVFSEGTDTLNVLGLYDGMFSGMYYEPTSFDSDLIGYDINASLTLTVEAAPAGTVPVPEPSTLLLIGIGLTGLVGLKRGTKK